MPVPDEEIMDLLEQATEIFATLGMELTGTKTGHQKDVIYFSCSMYLYATVSGFLCRV